MDRARARSKQPPHLRRDFEQSRLEDQLIAAAYELVAPITRRALPASRRCKADDVPQQPPSTAGGFSA